MIWERYILKEFLRCFFTFLFCFFFLYILIDYASHPSHFYFDHHFQGKIFITYYTCDLLYRFSAIAPFVLLISCIKVVCQLVLSNELLAMMASGVTVKRLLRPIVFAALFIVALIYLNFEFLNPKAIQTLNQLNDAHKYERKLNRSKPLIRQVSMKDGSIILFQKYDSSRHLFSEVYWIRHIGDIYHMKTLSLSTPPEGSFIDRFQRNNRGELVKTESSKLQSFPEMRLKKDAVQEIITPPEDQPLSALWKKLPKEKHLYIDVEAQVLAAFYNKLATPWLCLIAVIAPIPFCLNFTRKLPTFAIYAGSLFGLIAFTILLNSAFLLGKRQILDPLLATSIPFLTLFSYFSWRYLKLT